MKFCARAMSDVSRETMLPDRFWWKNDSDRLWMCSYRSLRSLKMTRCPPMPTR